MRRLLYIVVSRVSESFDGLEELDDSSCEAVDNLTVLGDSATRFVRDSETVNGSVD